MFLAQLCDHAKNCRYFGPFKSEIAARDWGMEAQEIGFLPHASFRVQGIEEPQLAEMDLKQLEEPLDLGFDPGL